MPDQLDSQTLTNIFKAQTLRGLPPTQRLVPYHSIAELLDQRVQQNPDKIYLIHYAEGGARTTYTYREFERLVNQTANWFQKDLGIRRADRIATIAHNQPDVLLIYFAAWKIGAAVAPQNVAEDDQRMAYILRNSQSQVVLVHEEYMERACRIVSEAPTVRQIVKLGGQTDGPYVHFDQAIAKQPSAFTASQPPQLDDECLLVYTSGTTGAPKGVVLTQYNLMVNAQSMAHRDRISAADRMMCVLPIHHVNGLVVTHVAPLCMGASTVLNRQFHSKNFWQRLADERVSISSVVPTILQFLLEADEDITPYDLSRLRFLICGAGTLSVALAQKFEERFGVKLIHGYGLSETTAYACHLPIDLPADEHRHWLTAHGYPSIGCPLDVNEMAIFDAAGEGRELSEGERGEIALRGHNIMKYYYQRPDANRETFRYGWFRSGDEGFCQRDAYGRKFFFITGRIKELINRGGMKFSPFDIEEALVEIPGVRVGLAIAFDNKYYGEEVGAYVVVEQGMHLGERQVLDYCRKRLGFAKSPKVVVFGNEVPVTTTGKYQRLKLKPLFEPWRETQFREGVTSDPCVSPPLGDTSRRAGE